ncbi:MAG: 5-bromo-4-chloroindolyl phosphate hydrolysis family protein [Tissierellales bacterium]
MNNRGNMNLGDEVKNIVQNAVSNKNFNNLNRDIENVVKGALDEVGRSIGWKQGYNHNWNKQTGKTNNYQQKYEKSSTTTNKQEPNQQRYNYNNTNNYNNVYKQTYMQNKPVPKSTALTVPMGRVSGTLLTIFGAIGSGIFGIAVVILAVLGYLIGFKGVILTLSMVILPSLITSVILLMNGGRVRKRLRRFQRYIAQLHGRNYCLISDLSAATGLSNKATVRDLQKMISMGMFPQGHIDEKKTCFMLNNECYEQYLNLQESIKRKELEEQDKQKGRLTHHDSINREGKNIKNTLKPEIRKAIEEGRQFVMEIKNANIAIPGEEVSRKLDRLEEVTGKIYDYVETHPEKFPEIKKFTEYFLPTTLKLLDAYRKFDYQPVQGENILSAKKEIEETMDTINLAFENLLDGLFEDIAMDISTDISVLQTMFAQEGLTENNIRDRK